MPSPLLLRRATVDDAAALALLNRDVQALHAARAPHVFKADVDQAGVLHWLRNLLKDPDNYIELALLEDQPAGYAWTSLERRAETRFRHAITRVHVHHLAVAPAVRRAGVGRALLEAARVRAREHGAAGVVLDTWGFNLEAQAFFRALGFEVARLELFQPIDNDVGAQR